MGNGRRSPDPILNDRAALVGLIDTGMTLEQIAARAGCPVATLRRAARRLGLPPSRPGRTPTPVLVDRDALATLIASGLSTAEIADQIGRSTNVVRSWVKRHGLAFPPHSNRQPDPPLLRDVDWLSAPTTSSPGIPPNPGDTKNCTDFDTQHDAQEWFDTYYPYYGDVAQLDSDSDGIACESLP